MLIIKLKVKGLLRNITENTEEIIDTNAIKNNNIISYIIDKTKYKLIIKDKIIILHRETDEFSHEMVFNDKKTTVSEYYLKEMNSSIEFNIITTNLLIENNKINITYKIKESENDYNYILEMSDINEY